MLSANTLARFTTLLIILQSADHSSAWVAPNHQTALASEGMIRGGPRTLPLMSHPTSAEGHLVVSPDNNSSLTTAVDDVNNDPPDFSPSIIDSAANITLVTGYAPPPVDKNLTLVHVKTADGHKAHNIALLPKGPLPLPSGPLKCSGTIRADADGLTWPSFVFSPLPSTLYLNNGSLRVGSSATGPIPYGLTAYCDISDTELALNVSFLLIYNVTSGPVKLADSDREEL